LREIVLATGAMPATPAAGRFLCRGLAGLVTWLGREPAFVAELHGALRPPWTPQGDPRLVALAESFGLLVATGAQCGTKERVQ
jgi:hypothetical protein